MLRKHPTCRPLKSNSKLLLYNRVLRHTHKSKNTRVTPNRSQYFPNFKYNKNTRDHCLNKFYKNICCTCNIFTLTVASLSCVSVIQVHCCVEQVSITVHVLLTPDESGWTTAIAARKVQNIISHHRNRTSASSVKDSGWRFGFFCP